MDNTILKQIQKTLKKIQSEMSTKDDLKRLRKEIREDIARAAMDVFKAADKNKAEKADLMSVEKRVSVIEETLQISPV